MPEDEPVRARPVHPALEHAAESVEDVVDEEAAADYSQRARDARGEQGLAPVLDDDDALDRVMELLDPHGIAESGKGTAEVPDKA